MRDASQLIQDIDKAKQAELLLNNQLLIDSLAYLKAETLDDFEGLTFRQTNEMVDCNRMLKIIDKFESRLIDIINDGNSALRELTSIKTHEESLKK